MRALLGVDWWVRVDGVVVHVRVAPGRVGVEHIGDVPGNEIVGD